jgi:hypothetical protein
VGKFTKRVGKRAREQRAQGPISARLLEFAKPMIDRVRDEVGELDEARLDEIFMIATTIWNAQVLEQWGRGAELYEQVKARLATMSMTPEFERVIAELFERKATLFPNDHRAITNVQVSRDAQGELRVQAEARYPDGS